MVNSEKAQEIQAAEVARNLAPDKFCPYCLQQFDKHGLAHHQVVKIGTLCPACGKKVT